MSVARASKQLQKPKTSKPTKDRWKTAEVNPKALFIWETEKTIVLSSAER